MEVIPDQGRIISAVPFHESTERLASISVFYEDAADGEVRVRLRPTEHWRPNRFRVDGHLIYWNHDGVDYRWDALPEAEIPDWWQDFRDRALAKMDSMEAGFHDGHPPEIVKD